MWNKSAGLNRDFPCGELAQALFTPGSEPPGTKSRWQGSVAAPHLQGPTNERYA